MPCILRGFMSTSTRALDQWFETPLGQYLWSQEDQLMTELLQERFGHHGLEIGTARHAEDCLRHASIAHRVRLACSDDALSFDGAFRGRLDSLGLQPRSVVAALVIHTLEFHPAPGRVLAALEQCLIPGGIILIAGFNPWSPWGVRRGGAPWRGRAISARRYRDWLDALNLKAEGTYYVGQRLPLDSPSALGRCAWMDRLGRHWPLGGAMLIVARKREYQGRRVAAPEREQRRLLAPSAPHASARTASRNSK